MNTFGLVHDRNLRNWDHVRREAKTPIIRDSTHFFQNPEYMCAISRLLYIQ
jgi:hypothetical protein